MADETKLAMDVTISKADNDSAQSLTYESVTAEQQMETLEADSYEDDQAELRFLHSKPTCFIILGKPGSGKTLLAKKLSAEWKCQLVSAAEVIMQEIEMQTETGQKAQEILLRGEAIPEEMAAKIIENKINSPEVAHHGYVLDGFPSLCEDYMSIKDQLELVKTWKLKPDFIINLKIPDKDLELRRIGQRVDQVSGEIYTKEVYAPEKPVKQEKEETEEEEEEEEEEEMEEEEGGDGELPPEILERLIKRPEDLPMHAVEGIKTYKSNMLRILEDYMADHDQQYLIELDANKNSKLIFQELMSRLQCFVLRPAAIASRLLDMEDDEIPEDIDTDELMRTIAPKRMVAPRYRWRRSRWLRYCPVSLAEGSLSMGKPEFAVSFLDKMYFLSSDEALAKFLKNPRPYLLPPQPRPPCKLCVLGPPLSGKTTLCEKLAEKYGASVLNIDELMKPKLAEEKAKQVEAARQEALENAIVVVKQKLKDQMEAEKAAAKTDTEAEIDDKTDDESKSDEEGGEEEENTDSSTEGATSHKPNTEEPSGSEAPSSKPEEAAPDQEKEAEAEGGAEGENKDDESAPSETVATTVAEQSEKPIEVDESHPDVLEIVNAAVKTAQEQEVTLGAEVWIEVMEEGIKKGEEEMRKRNPDGPITGGWILDNFPRTRDQWTALVEKGAEKGMIPDDVIYLKDESENGDFLIKRWFELNRLTIEQQVKERQDKEAEAKRIKEEEARLASEEAKRLEALEIKRQKEAERQRRLEAGEELEDEEEGEEVKGDAKDTPQDPEEAPQSPNALPEVEQSLGGGDVDPGSLENESQGLEKEPSTDSPVDDLDPSSLTPSIKVDDVDEEEGDEQQQGEDGQTPRDTDQAKPDDTSSIAEGASTIADEVQSERQTEKSSIQETTETIEQPSGQEEMPPEGPELDAQREVRKNTDQEWQNCLAVITSNTTLDPVSVDIFTKSEEGTTVVLGEDKILEQATTSLEKKLQYMGWELQGMDIDEEEEDAEADAEEAEEEPEEEPEEEDPNRATKKQLGDLNYYCPVALQDKGVLWPGNPEVAAKFREKIYYLSTPEARDKFLEDPTTFLPKDKPFDAPPIRLFILGPKGAGKSLHGRHLAQKLGIFHIQYKDRLQELVIKKTKKKIGPEYEEQEEEEEPEEENDLDSTAEQPAVDDLDKSDVEEDEEEEGAITAPDGSKLEEEKKDEEEKKEGEEGEEEEGPQFTEDEEAIVQYLKEDEPLPPEVLDKIVPDWWNKEPFKSTGFLIEGFPRNSDECEYMATNGLFPDAAIVLQVEDTDVIGRLLPPKLDKWRQKRDKKLARRQKIKDKAKKKREEAIAKRRAELVKELEEKRAERKAQKEAEKDSDVEDEEDAEEEEEEEEEEEDNIDEMLAEEFEEEEEEEEDDDETEEDATDRMRNDLEDIFDKDTNALATVQDKLEEMLIPRFEIEAGKKSHIVRYMISKKLKNTVTYRHSLFERVYPISERLATKMLQSGYKQPSRFGKWCPVKLQEGDCVQPMQGPGYNTYPAIYRSYIYFLSSQQNREQFMLDPMTYLRQPSPKPVVPMKLAIIGPPKAGKTTLSKRFADDYGMVRLSIGEALRMCLEMQPNSNLSRNILAYLKKGLTVPDELAVQALEVALMDMKCQTRGYVLDGYPLTKKQVDLMTERSIIPVRMIELELDSKEVVTRATKDRYSPDRTLPLHDSAQILAVKLASWQKEVGLIREWFDKEHSNLIKVNGDKSKWWVWNRSVETAKHSVEQIQTYLQRLGDGRAASIADMCITPKEFESRLGAFKQYCPVSLALRGELVDCSVTSSLKYAVEFRGHYYKTAGTAEQVEFLKDPERFVPPNAPRDLPPPELLPIRRTAAEVKTMFPIQIQLQGYCPVTYLDGKCRYEAIVAGDPTLVVEYRSKIFYFESEDKLQKFMRLPEKYWNLKLPHKLPPKTIPIAVTNLPMLGYMEQTVATAITKALTAVGNCKPKYPFLSPTHSALVYVAYHLKAYNPKSSEYVRKKYKKKLMQFEETCELIKYLGDHMTKRYKEPRDRPIDFDFKMEKFIAIKDWAPQATADTWVS